MTTIYSRQITTGAALREGRAPSHDGEYLTLYYAEGDFFLAGNGGPCEVELSDLRETVEDGDGVDADSPEAWRIDAAAEAAHIIAEIALVEADPAGTCEIVTDPNEAMSPDCRDLAHIMGWQWGVA